MEFTPALDEIGWCPFGQVTGRPCPLCGGTRALVSLVRLDPGRAWGFNAFVVVSAVAAAAVVGVHLTRRVLIHRQPMTETMTAVRVGLRPYVTTIRPGPVTYLILAWAWNIGRW